jgi:hypothetical protein
LSFFKYERQEPSTQRQLRVKKEVKRESEASDGSSDEEKENDGRGRRNIRPVIDYRFLEKKTKDAIKEEKQRQKRVEKNLLLVSFVTFDHTVFNPAFFLHFSARRHRAEKA